MGKAALAAFYREIGGELSVVHLRCPHCKTTYEVTTGEPNPSGPAQAEITQKKPKAPHPEKIEKDTPRQQATGPANSSDGKPIGGALARYGSFARAERD